MWYASRPCIFARLTSSRVFAEFFNLPNRPNFGQNYGTNAFSPATFNQPIDYMGGPGSSSSIPNSFQVQLGARYSF